MGKLIIFGMKSIEKSSKINFKITQGGGEFGKICTHVLLTESRRWISLETTTVYKFSSICFHNNLKREKRLKFVEKTNSVCFDNLILGVENLQDAILQKWKLKEKIFGWRRERVLRGKLHFSVLEAGGTAVIEPQARAGAKREGREGVRRAEKVLEENLENIWKHVVFFLIQGDQETYQSIN